jgi:LysR family hydrogen peroxide-inducible transcriptional activator
MNIQQFQYIMAVAEDRHFEVAARKSCITQSTLSTMISRFEDEIGIIIFDRKKRPVELTTEGEQILDQLKKIHAEIDHLNEMAKEMKGEVKGNLSISVIPTIAPYLLPLFLQDFATKFSNLKIMVKEQTTGEIIRQIKSRELDIGILSIPVREKDIIEWKLYDEPFVFYDAGTSYEDSISAEQLDLSKLCLLEEGHCMRTQVLNLCELHKMILKSKLNFEYKAGSINSLMRFVKANGATTLLPYLSTLELSDKERRHIIRFADPIPYRTVGIVVHRHFVKNKILDMLKQEIREKISGILPEMNITGEKLLPLTG